MKNCRKTWFISDLHLEESRPDIANQLIKLLQQADDTVDALYILGDLFEVWIGDDNRTPFHLKMMQALQAATARGLPVYFICGNRDFLIGKEFLKNTGSVLLPHEYVVTLYGKRVLLMHGDTLCTNDHAYLKARKLAHNFFIQKLFLFLPLFYRRKIAANMRAKSASHTQSVPKEIMDVTQSEVERVMRTHQVQTLIHGHTHRPATHSFDLDGKSASRIVLPAWHDHGHVLVWHEDGRVENVDLN